MLVAVFGVSLIVTFLSVPVLLPRLEKTEIVGREVHKPGQPKIPRMGGLAIVVGFSAGVFLP